ncbi:hypothetical protein FQA39_LY04912 [Lamprigera yunnana]|nr:hypothetical protein FQA39_LY04912 [Lamprigera yunnana]
MKGLEIEIVTKGSSENKLEGRTAFITGGSKGIGKEIALRLARDGVNVIIAAKSDKPHLVQELENAGGRGFCVVMDIRNDSQVKEAIEKGAAYFGGIDILINNANAITSTDTEETQMNNYDLVNNINVRGTFLVTKMCLPYLKKGISPHILIISPPINLRRTWFTGRVAYTLSKYGMSMCLLGMAEEFKGYGIMVNCLWPRVIISNEAEAVMNAKEVTRKPSVMADAAYSILTKDPKPTGMFYLDDEALSEDGIKDFEEYCTDPEYVRQLMLETFVDDSGTVIQKAVEKKTINIEKSETSKRLADIMKAVQSFFDEELVKKVQTIFQIVVTGSETKEMYIDLKSPPGKFVFGKSPDEPDVTITMNESIFFETFVSGIKPSFAFTNNKLKVEGDRRRVLLLDQIVKTCRAKL